MKELQKQGTYIIAKSLPHFQKEKTLVLAPKMWLLVNLAEYTTLHKYTKNQNLGVFNKGSSSKSKDGVQNVYNYFLGATFQYKVTTLLFVVTRSTIWHEPMVLCSIPLPLFLNI